MNNQEDYPSDSDQSDEDFRPENEKDSEISSDEDNILVNDGDENSDTSSGEGSDSGNKKNSKTKKLKSKQKTKLKKKNKCVEVKEKETIEQEKNEIVEEIEEVDKEKSDLLWSSFLSDVSLPSKSNSSSSTVTGTKESSPGKSGNCSNSSTSEGKSETKPATVTVTKIYDFAGEEVKVEEEVPLDSLKPSATKNNSSTPKNTNSINKGPIKRPATGSVSAILGKIGKKNKITVFEKSKLDWGCYKNKEGLKEEIQTFNKGKHGYLDRQDFLQRTDYKQFEIESSLRKSSRSKR